MAMKILSGRVLSINLPLRVCLSNSKLSSSSSSTPTTTKSTENQVSDQSKATGVKKESFRSFMSSLFGGYMDPADPKDSPIPAAETRLPNLVDHATGEHKLLLLAFEAGYLDPYCNLPVTRAGRGTKDNPVPVESFSSERIVGCICEETQNHIKYTNLYKGEPKRCQCGYWMKLVDAPKFWLDIPKDDLLTIPYFQFLEQEGKLDKLLSGELDKENEHAEHHH